METILRFWVPCVEHQGDITHFENVIRNLGGKIIGSHWSGMEDDDAYIVYKCNNNDKSQILNALENE